RTDQVVLGLETPVRIRTIFSPEVRRLGLETPVRIRTIFSPEVRRLGLETPVRIRTIFSPEVRRLGLETPVRIRTIFSPEERRLGPEHPVRIRTIFSPEERRLGPEHPVRIRTIFSPEVRAFGTRNCCSNSNRSFCEWTPFRSNVSVNDARAPTRPRPSRDEPSSRVSWPLTTLAWTECSLPDFRSLEPLTDRQSCTNYQTRLSAPSPR